MDTKESEQKSPFITTQTNKSPVVVATATESKKEEQTSSSSSSSSFSSFFSLDNWKTLAIIAVIIIVIFVLLYFLISSQNDGFLEGPVKTTPESDFNVNTEVANLIKKQEEYLKLRLNNNM
jgi:hypothetical protein